MFSDQLAKLNLEETRRRSLIVWKNLPPEIYLWKPDPKARTTLEMVRHVLEGEHLDHLIIKNRGPLRSYTSPWEGIGFSDVESELEFAKNFREDFMTTVGQFIPEDLSFIKLQSPQPGRNRRLGDFLMIIAYHEAVHTGQLLGYMRTFGAPRPSIWN